MLARPNKPGFLGMRLTANQKLKQAAIHLDPEFYTGGIVTAEAIEKYAKCLEAVKKKKAADDKWNAANQKKIKAANAKWAAANPEKIKSAGAKRYAENPEKVKAAKTKWQTENPEYNAKWRAENQEKVKAAKTKWAAENRERRNAQARARSAAKRQAA